MIYLKMSRSNRSFVKRSNIRAFYDEKTDKIILLKMREDEAAGVLSHEFMHKMFCNYKQYAASGGWDKNIIIRLEERMGWHPSIVSFWLGQAKAHRATQFRRLITPTF